MAQGCLNNLASWPPESLALIRRVGPAKSCMIAAAMELGRRRQMARGRAGARITTSADVHLRFVDRLSDLQHEEFWAIMLRRSNQVMADVCISRG